MPHCTPGYRVGHGRRQQVRRRVAVERQRFRAVGHHESQRGVRFERRRQVYHPVVHDGSQGALDQPRRQVGPRKLPHGRATGHLTGGTVGKSDGDHAWTGRRAKYEVPKYCSRTKSGDDRKSHGGLISRNASDASGTSVLRTAYLVRQTSQGLVGTGGLEPPTSCMSSRRSNQLSYAPPGRQVASLPPRRGRGERSSIAELHRGRARSVSTAFASVASVSGGVSSNGTTGTSTSTSGRRPRV